MYVKTLAALPAIPTPDSGTLRMLAIAAAVAIAFNYVADRRRRQKLIDRIKGA